jgi:hypothetical protein
MLFTKKESAKLNDKKKLQGNITRVIVQFDVGFNNNIFIRGNDAGLNWEKGIMLRNTQPNEWIWETEKLFNSCEFKILINDSQYELGDNHMLDYGRTIRYTPHFNFVSRSV